MQRIVGCIDAGPGTGGGLGGRASDHALPVLAFLPTGAGVSTGTAVKIIALEVGAAAFTVPRTLGAGAETVLADLTGFTGVSARSTMELV